MYYFSKVKFAIDTGKGVRYKRETYLIEAVSVTDAEVKTHEDFADSGIEFEVEAIVKSPVVKVL